MKTTGKALLVSLCVAASTIVVPTVVSAGVIVDVDIAPPVVRVEPIPPPRVGFVWAPGFWDYQAGGHVWVPGRWMGARPGWHWAPDHWVRRGPHWHHAVGHWVR